MSLPRFYRSRSLRRDQRSNQKLHHDVAHLHPLTNVPTKYQLPTPYGFRDIDRTRFYGSRSLRQSQRSNQGQTMMLHTYTPNQSPYQDFIGQGHYGEIKGQIKVRP